MDLFTIIGLFVLMYLVPELLRPKKQQYEYPDVPELNYPAQTPPADITAGEGVSAEWAYGETGEGKSAEWEPKIKSKPIMPAEVSVPQHAGDEEHWQGRLSSQDILQGVIFAEILQPPRSKRPLAGWRKL